MMDATRLSQTPGTRIETSYGYFLAKFTPNKSQTGGTMELTFIPTPDTKAANRPVGLIQTTRLTRSEMPREDQYSDDSSKLERMTPLGTHIDQSTYVDAQGNVLTEKKAKKLWSTAQVCIPQTNPVYNATNSQQKTARSLVENTGSNSFGCIYDSDHPNQPARLTDSPERWPLVNEKIVHVFEVAALMLTAPYWYLGSITWGYEMVTGNSIQPTLTPYPPALCTRGIPNEEFLKAAELWNAQPVIDYSLNEKILRVQIPLPRTVEVTQENLEAKFGPEDITRLAQGEKAEYRANDGTPWRLVKLSGGKYTFLTY